MKLIFLFKRSHVQTKKILCLQRNAVAKDFPCVQYFCRKKITRADYRIFSLQRIRIFPVHKFCIDFRIQTFKSALNVFLFHWKFTTT